MSTTSLFKQHVKHPIPWRTQTHRNKDSFWLLAAIFSWSRSMWNKLLNVLLSIVMATLWPLAQHAYTRVESTPRDHIIHHLCWCYKYRPVPCLSPLWDTNEIICKYAASVSPDNGIAGWGCLWSVLAFKWWTMRVYDTCNIGEGLRNTYVCTSKLPRVPLGVLKWGNYLVQFLPLTCVLTDSCDIVLILAWPVLEFIQEKKMTWICAL